MKPERPRPIPATEYDALIALWEAAGLPIKPKGRDSREAFESQNARGIQFPLGLWDGDQLLGSVLATHDGRKGWINRLAVHPDYRRQGLAKVLIEAAEQVLRDQGIDVIAALIEPENEASLELFRAVGYEEYEGLHYVSKRSNKDS